MNERLTSLADLVPRQDVSRAVDANLERFCELLRSTPDGSLPVPGLDWTVGELGAHLVSGARLWRRMLAGEASPVTSLADGASHTARMIEELPERDPAELSELIDNEIGATLGELNRRPSDQAYPWHAGLQLTMAQASAIGLGELVVHGFDLARALHKPWPIDRRDARYVIYGASAILPAAVDHAQAAGFSACYELRLRSDPPLTLRFDRGALTVQPGGACRPDCSVSVDPAAFVLLAYGRRRPWRYLASGKLFAWGRRPWLAARFQRLLLPF